MNSQARKRTLGLQKTKKDQTRSEGKQSAQEGCWKRALLEGI